MHSLKTWVGLKADRIDYEGWECSDVHGNVRRAASAFFVGSQSGKSEVTGKV